MALALVVVASPSRDSFAHAMAAVATSRLRERGYEIAFHDLYDEGFDPEGAGPEGVPTGLLRARHALIFNTSNTPADREREVFGDPLEALWKACVFGLCGVSSVIRRMYGPMAASSSQQRELWLTEVRTLVENAA
ncbi:MAG: NAD(P)H-dependent oxidoreductase [Burkholderiales bacterium]|nr:NAD(P)H-dependent oxidoreductase [Burkholderiales bacterium]